MGNLSARVNVLDPIVVHPVFVAEQFALPSLMLSSPAFVAVEQREIGVCAPFFPGKCEEDPMGGVGAYPGTGQEIIAAHDAVACHMPVEQTNVTGDDFGELVLPVHENRYRLSPRHHQAELAVRVDQIGKGAKEAV